MTDQVSKDTRMVIRGFMRLCRDVLMTCLKALLVVSMCCNGCLILLNVTLYLSILLMNNWHDFHFMMKGSENLIQEGL